VKVGRKKGYRKPDPRKKDTITLPPLWWGWLDAQKWSRSQMIQRGLEDLKTKIEGEDK